LAKKTKKKTARELKADKDDKAALAWLAVEGKYDRQPMIERIRANPPCAEIIAALAWAQSYAERSKGGKKRNDESCLSRIRELDVASPAEFDALVRGKPSDASATRVMKAESVSHDFKRKLITNSIREVNEE
jgi:hypothetical protein